MAAVALCMSGVDRPEDVAMVKRWLSTLFAAESKTKISVQNDACAALAAGPFVLLFLFEHDKRCLHCRHRRRDEGCCADQWHGHDLRWL